MRKFATGQAATREAFQLPTVLDDPGLRHLAEIAAWLRQYTDIRPSPALCTVAKAAAKMNFEVERKRLQKILEPGE